MNRFAQRIRPHVEAELASARAAVDPSQAFRHLENAHVLGQASTALHVLAHWRMLRWGVAQRSAKEISGQMLRLAGAAAKTAIGWVPRGNTGGSNVPPWRRMPVPASLQRLLDDASRGV